MDKSSILSSVGTACAATAGMIESLCHRVDAETDGLSALKVFSENPDKFDLAIIEPMLPDLMDPDLAIRFRHIRPGFPVLCYAGHIEESLSRRTKAESLGRVAFKPFILNELAAAIADGEETEGPVVLQGALTTVRKPV